MQSVGICEPPLDEPFAYVDPAGWEALLPRAAPPRDAMPTKAWTDASLDSLEEEGRGAGGKLLNR